MYIASQIVAFIALILDLISRVLKNKKHILWFMAIACILYTSSYALLQSPLPMIADFIATIKNYIDKEEKKYSWYLVAIIVINTIFIIIAILLWNNILDIILIVSILVLSVGLSFKNVNIARITLIVHSCLWMIYNLSLCAYVNFVCDLVGFSLALGALIYYNVKNKTNS